MGGHLLGFIAIFILLCWRCVVVTEEIVLGNWKDLMPLQIASLSG